MTVSTRGERRCSATLCNALQRSQPVLWALSSCLHVRVSDPPRTTGPRRIDNSEPVCPWSLEHRGRPGPGLGSRCNQPVSSADPSSKYISAGSRPSGPWIRGSRQPRASAPAFVQPSFSRLRRTRKVRASAQVTLWRSWVRRAGRRRARDATACGVAARCAPHRLSARAHERTTAGPGAGRHRWRTPAGAPARCLSRPASGSETRPLSQNGDAAEVFDPWFVRASASRCLTLPHAAAVQ